MATVLVATILFAIFSNSHAIWCYIGETKNNSTVINPWDSPANFCYRMTTKSKDYIYYMFDDGICEKVDCWLDEDEAEWCCCNTDLCNYNFTLPTTTISPSTRAKSSTHNPSSTPSATISLSTHPSLSSTPAPPTTTSLSRHIFDSYFFSAVCFYRFVQNGDM
ncbi:unnamed protein product [Cylicocyclus nassatus]|uniref:Uncharacterized protein n=1 Tax=Cylicocyclus nassatus TaxID=53992 RepID=A0AA36MAJ4_CYLNA|nr:unnamed protein product [Cylicocyclus nassatus]